MVSRRNLKDAHELSVLNSFEEYLKEKGSTLDVKTRPDPPDAFVSINGIGTWVEITDAFYNQDVAISITSYAADDVAHRPSRGGLVGDPDQTTGKTVESVIVEKLTKNTMNKLAGSHGKGILLVGLFGPFFDMDEIECNFSQSLKEKLHSQSVFDSIYIYETCNVKGHRFKQVL